MPQLLVALDTSLVLSAGKECRAFDVVVGAAFFESIQVGVCGGCGCVVCVRVGCVWVCVGVWVCVV